MLTITQSNQPVEFTAPVGCRLAKSSGYSAIAALLVLVYLMPRNSFLQRLFKCDFLWMIRWHR